MDRTPRWILRAAAGAVTVAVLALTARLAPADVVDRGRFIVYQKGAPIGSEQFEYDQQGDSLVVTGHAERTPKPGEVVDQAFSKSFLLVANALDFGLVRYLSNEKVQGHERVYGILPTDTLMTVYREFDGGGGDAAKLIRPPGRLFVMDPGMFTLFDVLCRNLESGEFDHREVQLVTLSGSNIAETPRAEVTRGPVDTLRWGGRRMLARRYDLRDGATEFQVWAGPKGQMLRFEHAASGLRIERDAPPLRPRKPAPR